MEEYVEIPSLPGYVSVKEAAKMLGLADKTVYEYVAEGRIPAVRAANVLMISCDEVQKFRPNVTGRPRKSIPIWRMSPPENSLAATFIKLHVKSEKHEAFLQCLEAIRRDRRHLFPGTVERYILESDEAQSEIQILLIWREAIMPGEDERKQYLEDLKNDLRDIVNWDDDYLEMSHVLMHT